MHPSFLPFAEGAVACVCFLYMAGVKKTFVGKVEACRSWSSLHRLFTFLVLWMATIYGTLNQNQFLSDETPPCNFDSAPEKALPLGSRCRDAAQIAALRVRRERLLSGSRLFIGQELSLSTWVSVTG